MKHYLFQTLLWVGMFVGASSPIIADEEKKNQISTSQEKWIKTYQKQKNVPKPGAMLTHSDPEPNLTDTEFAPLFDGTTLTGWKAFGGKCEFTAKDGVIIGTCVQGSPSTYLCTEANYQDFIFTGELKHVVDGNTGIMFRAGIKTAGDKTTVFGPQCEVEAYSKKRYWSGGIYGQSVGGWLYPMWLEAHAKTRESMNPLGEWNRITIQAKGGTIKTWLNGKPAAHWQTTEYLQGVFGLQIHSGKEGQIHFRNLKVKELGK